MRFFSFNINDLVLDPEGVAQALMVSCRRNEKLSLQTIIQLRDEFTAVAVPSMTVPQDLQFQLMEHPRREELLAAASARWQGGYDIVGSVTLPESGEVMVLFQKL